MSATTGHASNSSAGRPPALNGPGPVKARRRFRVWLFALAAVAVIVVPLAINGLFTGALADAKTSLNAVPAAVVNNDKMITTTNEDGTESVMFAGRGLVTELTGPTSSGFDWNVTNEEEAKKGLANGTYFAVLTIPENFSKQVNTQASTSPEQGMISIQTDDAHGYLSGLVANTVASAVQAGFGNTITAQVVNGVYTSFGTVGTQLADAASGAGKLADGATALSTGLGQAGDGAAQAATGASALADGLSQYASGAGQFSSGVSQYTSGVSQLNGGLQQLAQGTAGLSEQVSAGISASLLPVTNGLTSVGANIGAVLYGPGSDDLTDDQKATLGAALGTLQDLGNSGSAEPIAALTTLEQSIAQLAAGSAQLDANSGTLASGASDLATNAVKLASGAQDLSSGLAQLAPGISQSATGAGQLASGATELATGLNTGADALKKNEFSDPSAAADVVAKPVAVDVSTANKVDNLAQIVTTIILPAALWLGALAVFLFLRPLSKAVLASAASTARLTARVFGRASLYAVAQVALVVVFLHTSLGVPWSSLPVTLSLSLMAALAFTAFHQLLTTLFGRIGAVISLVLFALQLASTGGLYPIQVLSGPFQVLSAITPLSYVVDGVRGVLVGGSITPVLTAFGVLAIMLVASLVLSGVALARKRRPIETGWLTPERSATGAPRRGSATGAAGSGAHGVHGSTGSVRTNPAAANLAAANLTVASPAAANRGSGHDGPPAPPAVSLP